MTLGDAGRLAARRRHARGGARTSGVRCAARRRRQRVRRLRRHGLPDLARPPADRVRRGPGRAVHQPRAAGRLRSAMRPPGCRTTCASMAASTSRPAWRRDGGCSACRPLPDAVVAANDEAAIGVMTSCATPRSRCPTRSRSPGSTTPGPRASWSSPRSTCRSTISARSRRATSSPAPGEAAGQVVLPRLVPRRTTAPRRLSGGRGPGRRGRTATSAMNAAISSCARSSSARPLALRSPPSRPRSRPTRSARSSAA